MGTSKSILYIAQNLMKRILTVVISISRLRGVFINLINIWLSVASFMSDPASNEGLEKNKHGLAFLELSVSWESQK